MKAPSGYITAPKGFRAAGISCGIKDEGKDLALLVCDAAATAAGTFTNNRFCAAPVVLSRERLRNGQARAVIINSGCANACTGRAGLEDAESVSQAVARLLKVGKEEVLVASTGRIGRRLPVKKIESGLEALVAGLSIDGGSDAAQAILTTDSCPKESVAQFEIDGVTITVGGMAKGAGMVYPGMATMLAFITTDITITASCLKRLLLDSVEKSFNCISIDGDSSTNDSVFVLASGAAGNSIIEREDSADAILFRKALDDVTAKLAEKIVRDGEGASKFIEIIVGGASDRDEAKRLAFAVANSPLFKTAIYGEQPNWGRILSALGASGVDLDPKGTRVLLQGQCVFQKGGASGADEDKLEELLKRGVIRVEINLERGKGEAKILTCDLTPQYVDLNSS